ncbi:nitrite/sulfite reductase [Cohnella cholangitidis]|uniref:Nitrite/sulfite reductase n=1 Tax=Cohnella cholangitidis TaxID=2598458 RepID=A0A7G5BXD5_9BACL|nr:nitrite/sulfite reductase [Cohnella cholangitidis]QMV41619.1 nitrite/sulfite reductase [Cohnella cholangitidis]
MAYKAVWMDRDPSKLNKFEFYKMEKDGLDIIRDIVEKYSKEGFASIPQEDFNLFKWAGVYQQKPNNGHFMMRIRIPGGVLTSAQARELAAIGRDYGRNLIDVTTRQAIQYHWLEIEHMPDIFNRLEAVGMSAFEACGDCPRTIVGNPLAGIDPNELFDTTPVVDEFEKFFLGNRDFSNLPRKYKMSISTNIYNSTNAEIQCLAFTPASKVIDGQEVLGFHVMVGGGLSAKPHLARQMDMFVRPEEALKVAIGVTTLFRDHGYREKRHYARLKYLVAEWGVEKFQEELIKLIGEMPSLGDDRTIGWNAAYFDGVHPQNTAGYNYVGLNIPVGRTNSDEFDTLADLADKYGDGTIRTTIAQNIMLTGVSDDNVQALLGEPLLQRLNPNPNRFMSRTVSCTGNEFCNLAIVETKEFARRVALYLDEHVQLDEPVRIHFIGCPNGCGQKHVADIGLQGSLVKTPEGMVDAYDIAVGGTLGPGAKYNTALKGRVKADNVNNVLEQLINFYKEARQNGESFHQFVERVGIETMQNKLTEILSVAS